MSMYSSIHRKKRGSLFIRDRRSVLRWASCFLITAGIGLAGGPAMSAVENSEYRTGAGDNLKITVFGHDDLSGEFLVDGSGYISFPLIGKVKAGNVTVRELETAIAGKLRPDYLKNPRVGVEVLNYRPFYIIGEVQSPGSYAYVNGMTVINAIALSGGYTYRGRENKLLIIRANDPERKKQPANHDTLVLPGDVIEVPERFF